MILYNDHCIQKMQMENADGEEEFKQICTTHME